MQDKRPSELPDHSVIDVGVLIDQGECRPYQRLVILMAALCILLDGFDNQALSFALPALMADWRLDSHAFAPVFAFGLIGVSIGSVCGGLLSDRIGRRRVLMLSVVLFGGFSVAMSMVNEVWALLLLRFVAAIGLGGAMPTATALVSEIAPARLRTILVTFTVVCFPLGGSLGGAVAGYLIPAAGWRPLFLLGGGMALFMTIPLYCWLPESPRFLLRMPGRWPELQQVLRRMGHRVSDTARYIDTTEQPKVSTSLKVLLGPHLRRNTVLLWLAFSCSLLAMQWVVSWIPTLLTSNGWSLASASLGLSAYNIGGVLGSVLLGFVVTQTGSRRALTMAIVGAATAACWLGLQDAGPLNGGTWLIVGLGIHGMFAHALQTSLSALSLHVFPTGVRATGSGSTIAFGRIVAALCGSYSGPMLIMLGMHWYFFALALPFLMTLLVVLLMTVQIESVRSSSSRSA